MNIADSPIANTPLGRKVVQLYKYLSAIPKNVKEENYWFYNISNLAYTLIVVLHTSWIITFGIIGSMPMMWLQFLSIAAYIIAIALNRKGHHVTAMIIGLVEVNIHQVIAVTSFGWVTGFQNFIPLVGLLPFLKYNEKWVTKFVLGIACLLSYLYIDFFVKNTPPTFVLTETEINFFILSNAFLCFVLVALWGIVLSISYQRTVNALLKKEQELFAAEKANEQAEILRQLEVTERDNEIFHLRNVALKNSNDEIIYQKGLIEAMVSEQEIIIADRTKELAETNTKLIEANKKLLELIQYNSHSLREPLARIMGAIMVYEYISQEEFFSDIWPQMGKAVNDLDTKIKEITALANDAIKQHGK